MGARFLGALSVAVLTAVLVVFTQSASARAAAGCDVSGSGTDRLCSGGHLLADQYIMSPNGRYRLYYQSDGHTLIYDTIDWDHWVHSAPLFDPHANAGYLMYGVNSSGQATTEVNLWSFTRWNTSALPYYLNWGEASGAGHFMRLDNDGCLRAYEPDGSFLSNLWC
jgi:hypothetical protein